MQLNDPCFAFCREYCRKLSLYRKRDWVCQLTGKAGLTYEEALVSESRARGLIQQVGGFPKHALCPCCRPLVPG